MDITTIEREFAVRAARIPHHGLGLSVDVYQPELSALVEALDRGGLAYEYLEVFKAPGPALEAVRRRVPARPLEYHGEGLWVTQPDWETGYPWQAEVAAAAAHLRILGSDWLTHECAAKQMAGYSFGTYLPPLFTRASADVTARHVGRLQDRLDRLASGTAGPRTPLVLLEIPPLTYVGLGDLTPAAFFRRLAERVPCGLVLDLGHVWTVHRYSGAWRRRTLRDYLARFLDEFPLERVVQIHLAGLAAHERDRDGRGAAPPRWIDAHAAPVPEVLYKMLAQTLAHPRLSSLKGVALEVDTKAVPQIVEEFGRLRRQFGWWSEEVGRRNPRSPMEASLSTWAPPPPALAEEADLAGQYEQYARLVTGAASTGLPAVGLDPESLDTYRRVYLPHEILAWGGDLREMFPETCRRLDGAGIAVDGFVGFWVREPRSAEEPYDFFLLKIRRFVEFVEEVSPDCAVAARREADELREAYRMACEDVRCGA